MRFFSVECSRDIEDIEEMLVQYSNSDYIHTVANTTSLEAMYPIIYVHADVNEWRMASVEGMVEIQVCDL